jgi:hypothetical protein
MSDFRDTGLLFLSRCPLSWSKRWGNPLGAASRRHAALANTMVGGVLAMGLAALGGCSDPFPGCEVAFRGGCVPATTNAAAVTPEASRPAAMGPAVTGPVATSPGAVRLGDPGEFADVDDKQCRSYGLTFATRDYADCRIRLSAQHRGLDPNVGTTQNSSGIR